MKSNINNTAGTVPYFLRLTYIETLLLQDFVFYQNPTTYN